MGEGAMMSRIPIKRLFHGQHVIRACMQVNIFKVDELHKTIKDGTRCNELKEYSTEVKV